MSRPIPSRHGLIAAMLCLPPAARAGAHAIIVESRPAPLAHVPAGTLALSLRYNSRIDAARSKLLLKHGGAVERLQPNPAASPDLLQASAPVAPGDYEIWWQVLATDGHVTRGRIPFTVDPPVAVAK